MRCKQLKIYEQNSQMLLVSFSKGNKQAKAVLYLTKCNPNWAFVLTSINRYAIMALYSALHSKASETTYRYDTFNKSYIFACFTVTANA